MSKKMATIDGNTAAAHVGYAFSEVAAIYPITPSSPMGELADSWAAFGRKNIFGETVDVIEMQSEAGASGAVHGALSAGALTTTFTASQGLLLMLPNMHKIAGEMLSTVFHIASRSLACQALSIFGDHSDVMSARNTGFGLLSSSSIQETIDLGIVAHLASLESKVPFLHFFEGFRISHEIQKVEMVDYETMASMLDMKNVEEFRKQALNPNKPFAKVGAENPDVYFQGRETVNKYYDKTPEIVQKYMNLLAKKTGRQYHLFDYYGHPKAEKIIISMGTSTEVIEETIDYLINQGEKVGQVKVRLYRPFSVKDLRKVIPESVKKIAVLDRTKEPGSIGEPLYLDIVTALKDKDIKIIGGRYGLSSKEFTPSMVKAVYDHLDDKAFHDFTVGIKDDVTNKSVPIKEKIATEPEGTHRCVFWGYGSDGTVGACKNSIKIIGDNTDMNAQGYFSYDSKKSGGITISHLRFGKEKIKSPYMITTADFVALHKPEYIGKYDILGPLKEDGVFLLNSKWDKDEVFNHLTREMQQKIIEKNIKFYNIDAGKIADELGLGRRINTVMQAAFFMVSGILDKDKAIKLIKDSIEKTYSRKGEKIVKMNWDAVDKAVEALEKVKVPGSVNDIKESFEPKELIPEDASDFAKKVVEKSMRLQGDDIPVSDMPLDGAVPTGTMALEKRGVATVVPRWLPEKCIQCGLCSLICPHAAIRMKQIESKDLKDAPSTFKTIDAKNKSDKDLKYKVQVYIDDCVECGNCVEICPTDALVEKPIEEEREAGERENEEFFNELPDNLEGVPENSYKAAQLKKPLLEFSGACPGCGETPYVMLLTQLFGERMIVANATGCSSIWGGTFPTIPYTKTKEGKGPAWANSLFEDNAEYGYGMRLATNAARKQLKTNMEKLQKEDIDNELKSAIKQSLELFDKTDTEAQKNAENLGKILPKSLKSVSNKVKPIIKKIIELQDYLVDRSIWCIGGDGWAYDIGYGGLDHVLAENKNINVLVLDTEVYSNTGGQSSKATPFASTAKFAAAGKRTPKKDLGLISMTYGYIYVASIALGANPTQTVKAMLEAEQYPGPSIVIAYAPCIAHGYDMRFTPEEQKKAVRSGYWPLYRFNPALKDEGKNPFKYEVKDSQLKVDMIDFLKNEVRYTALERQFPEIAEKLFEQAVQFKKDKHEFYKKFQKLFD